MPDRKLWYVPAEIRTALMVAGKAYPDGRTALLAVAVLLGLDIDDLGEVMAGWPEGTMAPPTGGFVVGVYLWDQ